MIQHSLVNYLPENYDVTVHLGEDRGDFHGDPTERWPVRLIDSGLGAMTGGRSKRIASYFDHQAFCVTCRDGVADVDVNALVELQPAHGRLATVTAVHRSAGSARV